MIKYFKMGRRQPNQTMAKAFRQFNLHTEVTGHNKDLSF